MPTIDELRKKIEQTDAMMIELLAKRQALSKQIGQLKSNHGQNIIDFTREKKLFEFYELQSEKHHLQADFVKKVFKLIISYSRRLQES